MCSLCPVLSVPYSLRKALERFGESFRLFQFEAHDVRVCECVPVQEGGLVVAASVGLAHDVRVEAKVLPYAMLGVGLED